jgi:SPP1 gp7 family putative phage head morphogenesis protein
VATVNQEFFDAMLRHQIGILRLSGKIRNDVLSLLDLTEKDLAAEIRRRLPSTGGITPANVRRMQGLERVVRTLRGKAWKDIGGLWKSELDALAVAEPQFVANALRTVLPFPIEVNIPSTTLLKTLTTTQPFEGKILSGHINTVQRADVGRIMDQVRIGMVQGESNEAIARRVVGTRALKGRDGVTQLTRNQVRAITRTATNHISNQANRVFTEENPKVFTSEIYVATLDGVTTPVCRQFDGEKFEIGKGPIPPLHFNCRSRRVGVIDDELVGTRFAKPTTEKGLVREFSKSKGLGNITRRKNLPRGTKGEFDRFARIRTKQLLGKVPAKVSYQKWLETQSTQFQDDVLGVTKARLFRRGGLPLKKFVNPAGGELTLQELVVKERQAFINAGLDPDNFK